MLSALRFLLIFDAAVLALLGLSMILVPGRVLVFFHFPATPVEVHLILAQWGCALATMAWGYLVAATDPVRHVAWIQVGIARGVLEVIAGVALVLQGVVAWNQGGLGIAVAAFVAVAYTVLYPRKAA